MSVLRRLLLAALLLGLLGATFVAGAFAHKYRARIRAMIGAVQGSSQVVQTNLYNLRVRKVAIPAEGRDGGIAALGSGLLFINRFGRTWYVDSARTIHPLALQVPVNYDEFDSDPFNATTGDKDRFSVKSVLVQPLGGDSIRLLAAHMWWYADRDCNVLRVSGLETTAATLVAGTLGAGTWRTVFESRPCRELNTAPGLPQHVTLGAGGRLALLNDREVILTVGEFSAEYGGAGETLSADDTYGKTVILDVPAGTFRVFTAGHRNAQGIAVMPDGRIWLTEHGARGGDELNLLRQGANYGAPHVSYGTQYEMMTWPQNPRQGRHDGWEKPLFSWVPSIATSQLIVLRGTAFPYWAGDLLLGTLANETLFRVRVEDGRVMFVEPIPVGHRIRDLQETAAGGLVLKTDDNFLVFLDNVDDAATAASLSPAERGAVIAGTCQSCHSMESSGAARIGPNLFGVVGRDVASQRGFNYSAGLRRVDGEWTAERLRQFLADPAAFAPGTSMGLATRYSDQQLADLVAYLATLR